VINSNFIIQYTNALYSTSVEDAPRYDEFRDMFSSGQIYSKEWLVKQLKKTYILDNNSCIIVGAWYGTLGFMIYDANITKKIKMLDIDPRCEKFVNNIIYDIPSIEYVTGDMYNYTYTEDIIINTSCEHIPDIKQWLTVIPFTSMIVLQSNNYIAGNGHVNCVNSYEEFVKQTGLTRIIYAGKLETNIYDRYMVIGYK
jgi:hypothetical protein